VTLALAEGMALFVVVSGTILVGGRPLLVDSLNVVVFLSQTGVLCLGCIVAFYYNDLYDPRVVGNLTEFAPRLLKSFGVALILLAGFYTVFPETRIAEGRFLSSVLVILGFLLPLRAIGYGIMRHRAFAHRVLIVGTGPLARKLIDMITARPDLRYEIVGVAADGPVSEEAAPPRYPVLGPLQHLAKIAQEARVDRIIVAMSERRGRMPIDQLLEVEARGICIEDGLQTYEYVTERLAIESLPPSLLLFSEDFRKTTIQLALRRLVSLAIAVGGLALTPPLMALIALAIKLDSRGPVLFVQDRVGLHGRHFRLLKFRTMVACERPTSEWVHDNEERITRVGLWLRKYRLDELPQFVNILRGDMELVGPRPHPVSNAALFAQRIPYYVLRSSVRPGVTGWAQIRYGYANNLDEEVDKMRYDLYYIKHASFWFDLRILVDTVKIVLVGRGSTAPDAYGRDVSSDRFTRPLPREGR
jgi:exopolysaccharide biosynthesis polyprenyl glycosylphosphotransferase